VLDGTQGSAVSGQDAAESVQDEKPSPKAELVIVLLPDTGGRKLAGRRGQRGRASARRLRPWRQRLSCLPGRAIVSRVHLGPAQPLTSDEPRRKHFHGNS
jgi:hypothetical protein